MIRSFRPYEAFRGFRGIFNSDIDPATLPENYVQEAENVDFHKDGKASRRKGYALLKSGSYRSVKAFGPICLAVDRTAGALVRLNPDYTTTTLVADVGDYAMDYDEHNGTIYYSNGIVIGYIQEGEPNTFAAPESNYEHKRAPVPGDLLAVYNNRLYTAAGSLISYSDAGYLGRFDMARNFIPLKGEVRIMEPVADGMFVSDEEGTYFFAGSSPDDFVKVVLANYPAIKGSGISVPNGRVVVGEDTVNGKIAAWRSTKGPCIGLNGGVYVNLGARAYLMPQAVTGATLYREHTNGLSQFVFVGKN